MNEVMNVAVKKAVPQILESFGSEFLEAAEPICNAIAMYGCRNQIMIRDLAVAAVPKFQEISDSFFKEYFKNIEAMENREDARVGKYMEALWSIPSEELDARSKIRETNNILAEDATRKQAYIQKKGDVLKGVGQVVGQAATIVVGQIVIAAVTKQGCQVIKTREMTKRTKILGQTVKEISPTYTLPNMIIEIIKNIKKR